MNQLSEGIHSSNSLMSFPPRVNGTIIACISDEISLTCSRSDSAVAITNWIFSPPVNCSSEVSHNSIPKLLIHLSVDLLYLLISVP